MTKNMFHSGYSVCQHLTSKRRQSIIFGRTASFFFKKKSIAQIFLTADDEINTDKEILS